MRHPAHIAVLLSGRGSNFAAVREACSSGNINATVSLVISNTEDAGGLDIARKHNIPVVVLSHNSFSTREAFDTAMLETLATYPIDFVVLAGFMRILTPVFIQAWSGRLLNIHPSLLPLYPGLNTHARALEAGDTQAGASVHFVTDKLDGGPVILQAVVDIDPADTAGTLAERILRHEHVIYPMAIEWLVTGHAKLYANQCYLGGVEQHQPPRWYNNELLQQSTT